MFDPGNEGYAIDRDPATVFVGKPFRLRELEKAVNKLLDRPVRFLPDAAD